MSITLHPAAAPQNGGNLGQYLLDRGLLSASELLRVRGERIGGGQSLLEAALHLYADRAEDLRDAAAQWRGLPYVANGPLHLCPRLLTPATLRDCLRQRMVPLASSADGLRIAVADPECDPATVAATFGVAGAEDISLVLTSETLVLAALQQTAAAELGPGAERRTATRFSFRKTRVQSRRWTAGMLGLTGLLLIGLALWPKTGLTALSLWACFTLACATAVKLSILSTLPLNRLAPAKLTSKHRPRISILVPLFREPEVAGLLQKRLARLRYPAGLLEILLLLEEEDNQTKQALEGVNLPPHVRILTVPDGQPRTKPRAMNYALDFCKGDIIGIYDAEDAPAPDQLLRVADAFADAPADLACVQGVLDYYNPRQGWLARCFTIEYASWFRVMLPGMRRLGFAIPLGGTTLFCRRDVLLEVGGWDAHNVTEDADLGIRLARFGYRSELLPSTTLEEANCHLLPWVRQRSRWLKGYMVTYLVHMRRPLRLLREMGLWQFLGLQLHFVTTLSQVLLAPLLWSFWTILFGLPHPLADTVPSSTLATLGIGFLFAELVVLTTAAIAVSGRNHRHLLAWVVTTHFYFPLAAFAAYKALYELIFQPVYWDKTQHGLSIRAAPRQSESQTAVTHRVQLQPGGESL